MRRLLCRWSWLVLCAAVAPNLAVAAVSCTVTATSTAFGTYNPLSVTPTYANGQVQISCTLLSGGTTNVNLVTSYSAGASGSYALRTMLSGANTLRYNLFADAAYTQIRGNGTGGSQTSAATLNLSRANPTRSVTSVIYGRIPASQDVAAGSYADTIVVTVTY
jgi:spore coat protein U-like protein